MKGLTRFDPGYSHKSDEKKFTIKVYSVICFQILAVVIATLAVEINDPFRKMVTEQTVWTTLFVASATIIAITCLSVWCFRSEVLKAPVNYISVFLLTTSNIGLMICLQTIKHNKIICLVFLMIISMMFGILMISCIIEGKMYCIYGLISTVVMGTFPVLYLRILHVIHAENAPWG